MALMVGVYPNTENMNIKTFPLDDVARDYMREVLGNGKTFAACLAQHNDLSQGEIETYLPDDVPSELINRFQWGGIFPGGDIISPVFYDGKGNALVMRSQDTCESKLYTDILQHLANNPLTFAVCENPIVNVDYPSLKDPSRKSHVLIYEEEALECVTSRNATPDSVGDLVGRVGGLGPWPGLIGAIVQGDEQILQYWGTSWRYLSKVDLVAAAQNVQIIVVGAYDGENYLVWTKQRF